MLRAMKSQNSYAHIVSVLTALLLAAVMVLSTSWLANQVRESALYKRSRVLSSIVSLDTVGVMEIVSDRRNIDVLSKFVGAVASAYINFELIPIHEASTFSVVYESINDQITIESFSYRRKNLLIQGMAEDEEAFFQFVNSLQTSDHFQNVIEHHYVTVEDTIRFEIECIAQQTGSYVNFT